jgi:hypothetical protein
VYDPSSKGAQSYRNLAREVAARLPDESPLPSVDDTPTVVVPPPERPPARAPRPLVGPDDVEGSTLSQEEEPEPWVAEDAVRGPEVEPGPADVMDEASAGADAEVEVERDLEESEKDRELVSADPEPTLDPAPPRPEPDDEASAPAPEPTEREIEAQESNGGADVGPAAEEGSREDLSEVAGNGDRSKDEAEQTTASGGGKRLKRLFRRGGS